MTGTLVLAGVLLVGGIVPALLVVARGGVVDRLVALELAAPVTTGVLLLLADGYGRSSYLDVGLVLALMSFAGTLVYARLFERFL